VAAEETIAPEVVAREQRWRRPAGLAAIAGVALFVTSLVLIKGTLEGDGDAGRLAEIDRHAGKLLLSSVVGGLGFALLAAPLAFLFRAAQARSGQVKAALFWLTLLAPVLLAISSVLHAAALDHVASRFVELHGRAAGGDERLADALIRDSGFLNLASGLGFAGSIGVTVAVFYSSVWGLRTGLLSRFLGTFGMAVAVVFVFIPFGVLVWSLALGVNLTRRRWPPDPAAPPAEPSDAPESR
jgi:hypothetical protein